MSTPARLQKFFLAYYGRPADVDGLAYWLDDLQTNLAGDEQRMGGYFGNPLQAEFEAIYGNASDPTDFIGAVFQNLFSRAPDAEGLEYWLGQYDDFIASGLGADEVRARMVMWILDGAVDSDAFSDATTLANRITASTSFTAALDTVAKQTAYADEVMASPGNNIGTFLIQGVDDTVSSLSSAGLTAAVNALLDTNPGQAGRTILVTQANAIVAPAVSVGTNTSTGFLTRDNDTVVVGSMGLDTAKVIDPEGSQDADVLTATLSGADFGSGMQIVNIETVELYTDMSGPLSLAGVTGVDAMVITGGDANFSDYDGRYLTLSQYYGGTLTLAPPVSGASLQTIELQGTVSGTTIVDETAPDITLVVTHDSHVDSISMASGTLTIMGSGALTLLSVDGEQYIDASIYSGDLTYTDDGVTLYAGSGHDTIALSTGEVSTLVLGDGNDTVIAVAGSGLVASDYIDFGSGTDSLTLTGNIAVAVTDFANLRSFESVTFANTTTNVTLVAKDSWLAGSGTLTIDASDLTTGVLSFNGQAETGGKFVIYGGAAADTIVAGARADTVVAGSGADSITLGGGDDLVTLSLVNVAGSVSGMDILQDFTPDADVIRLRDSEFAFFHASADGVLLDGGRGETLDEIASAQPDFTLGTLSTGLSGEITDYLNGDLTIAGLESAISTVFGSASDALFSADARFLMLLDDDDHSALVWVQSDGADDSIGVDELSVLAILKHVDSITQLSVGTDILFI